ncbi:MAG: polyprenyl synthetase family protein [Anaerolineae bacterium]|nr:polyprenyl synthetase family protein [Anaerolineae bacterium]MDW8072204.1 polyprenyl synthetase family protein [Anaerolineae bacterium]
MGLQQALDTFMPLIEQELRACMPALEGEEDAFVGMIHYHMGWSDEHFRPTVARTGKRLRPLLTLLSCQAAGGVPQSALPAAAAVEIIHNFSLVHDDIEDRSPTRRGRRTVWSLWGDAQAINTGDAMFVLAHLALQRLSHYGVPDHCVVSALRILDEACLALCRGQYLDLAFESTLEVDAAAYMAMIRGKTAALLGCAMQLGALIALGELALTMQYRSVGEKLGLAFQIQDDILGIWGEPAVTGKPTADDLRSRKKTLPVIYALSAGGDSGTARLRYLYSQERLSEADVAEAVRILDMCGARAYAEQTARRYLDETLAAIEALQAEPQATAALRELALSLMQRAH